jgi:hypothetical protein
MGLLMAPAVWEAGWADLAEHAKSVSVFITCRPRNDRISEGGGPDRRLGNERPIQPGLVRDER